MRSLCIWMLSLSLIGCAMRPQVDWSPDGKTAVYQQTVIDPSGRTVDQIGTPGELGIFNGSSVWSADSTSLYFVRQEASGKDAPVTALRRWVGDADADKTITQAQPLPTGYPRSNVYRLRDGKTEPLVTLWATWVMSMAISSDQHWLLIDGIDMNPGSLFLSAHLRAYQLQSRKLYTLSDSASNVCFIGPNRIAYVEPVSYGSGISQVIETTLDESLATLTRTPRLTVLSNSTNALAGSDSGLLVLTSQATFPSPTTQPIAEKIYSVPRSDRPVHELAAASMGMMSLSPDRKHVLFIRPSGRGASDELCMMNVDGTQLRMLMDLAPFQGELPLMPTWHGNDRITFASTTGKVVLPSPNPPKAVITDNRERVAYDIVDYTIPPAGSMKPDRVISQDWKADQKPSRPLLALQPTGPAKD